MNRNYYDKLIIYYFSGTGNARNAAHWIGEVADEMGMQILFINIDRFETIKYPEIEGKTLIGFCFPTHGFNAPPLVLKFITKFPNVKNVDAFILNTRGGIKLSKAFIPGMSGLAQILPAFILMLKGFCITGMQPLDLPSNWLILHPGLREKVIVSIYKRCNRIVKKFGSRLLHGKRKYQALWSLPFDIFLIPVAIGYYIIGRFFLAKTLIATDACNSCRKCIKECPVKAIVEVKDRPFWTYRCESCMRCVNNCPQRAIETMHAFATGMILISLLIISPALTLLLGYLGAWKYFGSSFFTGQMWSLIYSLIYLIIIFISYGILHYLMRFRLVNKIITYTSLSTYRFWRRYKPPKDFS